jgi:hypothetical protein
MIAQPSRHFETVDARKPDIQEDQIRPQFLGGGLGLLSMADAPNAKALGLEIRLQ